MTRFAFIVMLILTIPAASAEIAVSENPVPANSFAECTIKVETKQSVSWNVYPEPVKVVEIDNTVYFNGPPGTYKVTATVFWIEGDKVRTRKHSQTVTLGKGPPGPIPVPIDDFQKAMQDAYDKESSPDKAIHVAKLASLYRTASTNLDPNIKTYGQLFDVMKTASRTLIPETAIPLVRRVVGDRLNPSFSAASSPIDVAKIQKEFKAVADALSGVK